MSRNPETTDEALLSAVEGALTLLQVLVVSLDRTGRMDTGDYIDAVLSARRDLIEPGSTAETVIDRMLDMLVKDGAEVLHRRQAIHLLTPDESPDSEQTPQPGDPGRAGAP